MSVQKLDIYGHDFHPADRLLYTARPDPDGDGWVAESPWLRGLVAFGSDGTEALSNAKDMTVDALDEHVRKCKSCRRRLEDWDPIDLDHIADVFDDLPTSAEPRASLRLVK